ncbi:MAG: DUF2786 domain-containing protein [Spirochaetes bacterium]|nr:MAG: DUF2786 domain-containing protein [Spirochaetota bacterium]
MQTRDLSGIIEKIRKLLALSKSPNRAEAAAALNKANELLLQYNLSIEQIKDHDSDPVRLGRMFVSGASKKWRRLLITKLAEVNLCLAILDHGGAYFIVVGRKVNTISVITMWDYLEGAVKRIHSRECPRQAKSHYRESFKLGISTGIAEKLEEQYRENTDPRSKALVVSLYHNEKKRIDDFLSDAGLKLELSQIEIERQEAYRKGLVHGRRVNLNMQIDSRRSHPNHRFENHADY